MSRFFQVKLENKRLQTYKTTGDSLSSTVSFMYNNAPSYIEGATIELWFNYTGTWIKYEDAVTDETGVAHILHNYSTLSDINLCLGQAKVIYKGVTYESNYTRYNFTNVGTLIYIVDAGTCTDPGSLDRSSYTILESSGVRPGTIYDRML